MAERDTPNYWDYLRLPDLLDLQGGLEGDDSQLQPDELHFIIVHQAFELWFKLMLRELRLARDHLAAPTVPEEHIPHVVHHLGRVNAILRLCAAQFAVMETLTPQEFLAFRNKLAPASGFQSFQMREIEILMGLPEQERVDSGFGDPLAFLRRMARDSATGEKVVARVEKVLKEQTLRDALHNWLYRTPIQGSVPEAPGDEERVFSFVEEYLEQARTGAAEQRSGLVKAGVLDAEQAEARFAEGHQRSRDFLLAKDVDESQRVRTRRIRSALLFIESYRELPLLAWPRVLLDAIVELEEGMVLFRHRHARMVERIIGRRVGTGGSSGVDYLDATTKYRVFTELWAVRTLLLPRSSVPALDNSEDYGFAR
ncbi:MAG TPA: tryptophan 2,3-dioxygenase [Deltaproteobacteria bacterium]|nr:tryptophan 2,3-dioxygenase [Deltaproteobacteria bacterium]HCP47922.1 tryptophan 2,3-dioxygenase [Deltaproteobacteria bacterium]